MKKRIGKYVLLSWLWCLSFVLIFSEIECEDFINVFVLTKALGFLLMLLCSGWTVRLVAGDEKLRRWLEE